MENYRINFYYQCYYVKHELIFELKCIGNCLIVICITFLLQPPLLYHVDVWNRFKVNSRTDKPTAKSSSNDADDRTEHGKCMYIYNTT